VLGKFSGGEGESVVKRWAVKASLAVTFANRWEGKKSQ